ncbi:MAG TPA: hypothetical protein VJB16_04490, partial [archaeon]|nr:hypothetical protein [archaeon]
VVAVQGSVRDQRLVATEVLHPDLPLPKAVPALAGTLQLGAGTGALLLQQNPLHALVGSDPGQLRIAAWHPPAPLDQRAAIALLQKRWLPLPPRPGPVEPALLDPAPDILWLAQATAWAAAYKAVTIVAAERARVDLETREVAFQ